MNVNFKKKTAIVTGGSRGIGRAIAEALLGLECKVLITSTGSVPKWCHRYTLCAHKKVDFMRPESVKSFITEIDSMEIVDILINNAGIQVPQPVYDLDAETWERVITVNLTAPVQLTRAVTPKMKAAASGKILNIASIAGLVSKPGQGAYSASKAGLIGFTRACALDMASFNVLVNALCPGPTLTSMVDSVLNDDEKKTFKEAIPLGRFGRPEEIAQFAVFLCSELNTYITGQAIVVDGGATVK